MNRREVIAGLGTAIATSFAAVCSKSANAQDGKSVRIGFLAVGDPDPAPYVQALREALRQLGYVEGRNLQIEFRSAGGDSSKMVDLASELVRAKMTVIVGYQAAAVAAAMTATRRTPIVMGPVGDPLGTGLVESLARPGGNVTGVSSIAPELAAKGVELIREAFPSAKQIVVLCSENTPSTKPFLHGIGIAARSAKLELQPAIIRSADELQPIFEQLEHNRPDAVIVQPVLPRETVVALALKHRFPTFSTSRLFAEAGGLMSYADNPKAQMAKAALYIDKIIKGANPGDLPVEQPKSFELIINLKTAKSLNIDIPQTILARADEVIE